MSPAGIYPAVVFSPLGVVSDHTKRHAPPHPLTPLKRILLPERPRRSLTRFW